MNSSRALCAICIGLLAVADAQEPDVGGFALPKPGRKFVFPRDHGSHPEFRTEWWYLTGHLEAADGERFGFQVTFFRQAGGPGQHLYLAHTAISQPSAGRFLHEERLNREGWDGAASLVELDVRNGNWTLCGDAPLRVAATVRSEAALELELSPEKPLVVFGKDGVSRKGRAESAASHYLTFPRLRAKGSLNVGGIAMIVQGEAWMDHEFSSSQLDEGQVGWDWASIQLHDGREIMVYRMRRKDGSSDPAGSTLARIDESGAVVHSGLDSFTWTQTRQWTSPRTGAVYPISPRIEAGGEVFHLLPLMDDQELGGEITGLAYWEGACDVVDASGKVVGRAFLELAGYSGDLSRHLRGVTGD